MIETPPCARVRTRRCVLGGLGAFWMASCAPRGLLVAAPDLSSGMTQTLWAVAVEPSTRARVTPGYHDRFGSISSFARYEVAIPQTHRVGQLAWPTAERDARDSFAIADQTNLETESRLFDEIASRLGPDDEIGVFVHGYNTTYSEAIYRHAQIAFDYELTSPQLTYVWPSDGEPLGYVSDRDRVLTSRDGLLRFLDSLSARFPNRVLVAGHSMGAFLVMEVLRQAALTANPLAKRLAGMVLISPDIGLDVFLSQLAHPGTLPSETAIVVSQSDRLLRVSQGLADGRTRLGEGSEIKQMKDLDIVVIDLSDAPGGDPSHHLTAMTSPTAISFLRALNADAAVLSDEARSGLLLLQITSVL